MTAHEIHPLRVDVDEKLGYEIIALSITNTSKFKTFDTRVIVILIERVSLSLIGLIFKIKVTTYFWHHVRSEYYIRRQAHSEIYQMRKRSGLAGDNCILRT